MEFKITHLKNSFFFFCFLFVVSYSGAQSVDSLKNIIALAKEDTAKVNALSNIAWELQKIDKYDESIQYIKEGIQLGEKLKYGRELAVLYRRSGDYYNYKSDFVEALDQYTKALDIETLASRKSKMVICYEKIAKLQVTTRQYAKAISNFKDALKLCEFMGDSVRALDDCLSLWSVYYKKQNDKNNSAFYLNRSNELVNGCKNDSVCAILFFKLGKFYSKEGDFEKAAEYLNKAIHLHEEKNDSEQLATDYYDLGNLYESAGNYQKALEYYLNILKIRTSSGTKHDLALANNNAGWGYQLTGDFQKALELQLAAYKLYQETGDDISIAYPLGNLGIIYNQLGAYEKAIEYSTKAIQLFEKNKDMGGVAEGYNNIGKAYLNMEKFDDAIKYLGKGLAIAQDENAEYEIKNSYSGLAVAYKKKGDYKKAFDFLNLFTAIRDSIANQENAERINRMHFAIENEKNQKAIELLNKDAKLKTAELQKQRTMTYAAIGGVILTLLLMMFAIYGYAHKKKTNEKLSQYNSEILSQKNEIEKLSIATSETANAVMITDSKGNIEWANSAFTKMTGYTIEEFKTLFGSNIKDFTHNPLIKEKVSECIATCKSVMYESINKAKSGKEIWMQTTLTPILDANGLVRNMVAIDTDITDLKRIDMEIKKQNEIITEKNKHITDSINYARHIQEAILPSGEIVKNILPNSFVLFSPKDIVSGD
ncbi:MAG TPA: tetratricopeptide repeat protein, partial [Bacteroidia bacterium]